MTIEKTLLAAVGSMRGAMDLGKNKNVPSAYCCFATDTLRDHESHTLASLTSAGGIVRYLVNSWVGLVQETIARQNVHVCSFHALPKY